MIDTHLPLEQTRMFAHFVAVANWSWEIANSWQPFARDSVGIQLVRAADSVGANLVEGDGRYSTADAIRFFVIARASARQTRYWIQRSVERNLVSAEQASPVSDRLLNGARMLNGLIRYRRGHSAHCVKEDSDGYTADEDPFCCDLDLDDYVRAHESASRFALEPNT